MRGSRSLTAPRNWGERKQEVGLPRGMKKLWGVMDGLVILIMVMVSWVCMCVCTCQNLSNCTF